MHVKCLYFSSYQYYPYFFRLIRKPGEHAAGGIAYYSPPHMDDYPLPTFSTPLNPGVPLHPNPPPLWSQSYHDHTTSIPHSCYSHTALISHSYHNHITSHITFISHLISHSYYNHITFISHSYHNHITLISHSYYNHITSQISDSRKQNVWQVSGESEEGPPARRVCYQSPSGWWHTGGAIALWYFCSISFSCCHVVRSPFSVHLTSVCKRVFCLTPSIEF